MNPCNPNQTVVLPSPRTPADFNQLALWVAEGKSNDQVLTHLSRREWRSEVVPSPGGNGVLCALCMRPVSVEICVECHQPVYDAVAFETDDLEQVAFLMLSKACQPGLVLQMTRDLNAARGGLLTDEEVTAATERAAKVIVEQRKGSSCGN